MEEEKDYNLDEGLVRLVDIQPLLELEAKAKNLKVFLFTNEILEKLFTPKRKDIGVILLAKDEDNALYNLKSLRKCYIVKI